MFLVSSCSCFCPIHWRQVLNRELENGVGTASTGDAPTTSEWSRISLPRKVCLVLEVQLYTSYPSFPFAFLHRYKCSGPVFQSKKEIFTQSLSSKCEETMFFSQIMWNRYLNYVLESVHMVNKEAFKINKFIGTSVCDIHTQFRWW